MTIKTFRKFSPKLAKFDTEQWTIADNEHYGHPVDWRKKIFVLQADNEGEILGCLKFNIEAGVAYVHSIIVDKEKRGKSVGKNLMKEMEKVAKQNGAHKIYLVTGKNWEAVKFYQSLGYKIEAELPKHYVKVDFVQLYKFI